MGLCAVLSQEVIVYFSCSLSQPDRNNCVTCWELLAVILGICHFRAYQYGRWFLLHTDHASLTLLNFKEPEGQLAWWPDSARLRFQDLPSSLCLNTNADALFRGLCDEQQCQHCWRPEARDAATSEAAAVSAASLSDNHSSPQPSAVSGRGLARSEPGACLGGDRPVTRLDHRLSTTSRDKVSLLAGRVSPCRAGSCIAAGRLLGTIATSCSLWWCLAARAPSAGPWFDDSIFFQQHNN